MAPLQGPSNATTRADTGRIEGAGRPMEIRHLDALLAITESGSFSAAAELLHTVQSNVSEQIRQLERELGVPVLVRDLRQRAPGVMLRINEGASERLAAEVVSHEVTMAVVTEPIVDPRLTVEHLLEEDLVGLVPDGLELPPEPVPFATMAG